MIKQAALGRARFAVLALVALFAVSTFVPAALAAKPKDGVYYENAKKPPGFGSVETTGSKITNASFVIKFKDKSGKSCVPEGAVESSNGYSGLTFGVTATKPNRKGKFTIKVKNPIYPGLKGTISGKFKSASKAVIKADLKSGGCTAKANYTKAVYTAGG
ncbi:MAG: hypothetical protein ACSLFD_06965 [Solirubrobacterales bacterium]